MANTSTVRTESEWCAYLAQCPEIDLNTTWSTQDIGNVDNIEAWCRAVTTCTTATSLTARGLTKVAADKLYPSLFDALRRNTSITSMELIHCGPNHMVGLANMLIENRAINTLKLGGNNIGDAGAGALAAVLHLNDRIHALYLGYNEITSVGAVALSAGIRKHNKVTILYLADNKLGDEGADAVAEIIGDSRTCLRFVNLGHNNITSVGGRALGASLCRNRTVTNLCVGYNAMSNEGAGAIAEGLRRGSVVTNLHLKNNGIEASGAQALANALAGPNHVSYLYLGCNPIGDDGAAALGEALKSQHCVLTALYAEDTRIGDRGAVALAEAFEENQRLTTVDLWKNNIGKVGAVRFAEALEENGSIESLDLHDNNIGAAGAIALAEALKTNASIRTLNVCGNTIGDPGLMALFWASKSTNRLQNLSVKGNSYKTRAVRDQVGSVANCAVRCDFDPGATQEWQDYLLNALVPGAEDFAERLLYCFILTDAADFKHDLGSVIAAWLNKTEDALNCLRRWPEQVPQVIQACANGAPPVVRPGCLQQRILDSKKKGESPAHLDAIYALRSAANALHSKAKLSIANVHICGEGYAGKSMTLKSLMRSFNCMSRLTLTDPLEDISLRDSRTLGMVTESLEQTSYTADPVRVQFHDYGGQEEFRANHAAYLASPNSVYAIVVPLWDLRPIPLQDAFQDKPMDLDHILSTYRTWLKFINSVVPKSGSAPQCVTVLNFVRKFRAAPAARRRYTVEELVAKIKTEQKKFSEQKGARLLLDAEPILVNANIPASVHKHVVPVLKSAIAQLTRVPVPLAPALQTVLLDMQGEQKWPLFTEEADLLARIVKAIAVKHAPKVSEPGNRANDKEVLDTIASVTLKLMEARGDIVLFEPRPNERISINYPNWLTEGLLGGLFNPRIRPGLNEAAAIRAVDNHENPTHLLTADFIWEATKEGLDRTTQDALSSRQDFIPRLLQHLGVCIPVVVDERGLACGVAEAGVRVEHWFPAFSTTRMKDTDCTIIEDASHIIARLYKLQNPEVCTFPAGYFSSLSVGVVSLIEGANLVRLFADGMELRSTDNTLQIVLRRKSTEESFTITVATAAPEAGFVHELFAYETMEKISEFILSDRGWRGNVKVDEFGLHPDAALNATPVPMPTLRRSVVNPEERKTSLPFFFGLKRYGKLMISYHLQEVMQKLEVIVLKMDEQHAAVLDRFEAINDRLDGLWSSAEAIEEVCRSGSGIKATHENLVSLLNTMSATLPAANSLSKLAGPAAPEVEQVVQATVASIKRWSAHLTDSTAPPQTDESQLIQLKSDILSEFAKVAKEMQKTTETQLKRIEAEQLRRLEEWRTSDSESRRRETQGLIATLQQYDAGLVRGVEGHIAVLQATISEVNTRQSIYHYSVREIPILAEIGPSEAKGSLVDIVKRSMCDISRLHFVCPGCGARANSGRSHNGYELRATKGWVLVASEALKVSLFALQVASCLTPIPLPRIAELGKYLPLEKTAEIQSVLDFLNRQATRPANVAEVPMIGPKAIVKQKVTRTAVEGMRALLMKVGETIPPQHTGLTPITCDRTKECAWVCGKCEQKYKEKGNASLIVQFALE